LYTAGYGLDFQVSSVPLPPAFYLFLSALPLLVFRRKAPEPGGRVLPAHPDGMQGSEGINA
jgi:hypothetical protein